MEQIKFYNLIKTKEKFFISIFWYILCLNKSDNMLLFLVLLLKIKYEYIYYYIQLEKILCITTINFLKKF